MPLLNRRETLALTLGALAGTLWRRPAIAAPLSGRPVRYENGRRYAITHSASVETGQMPLRSLEVWLPLPMQHPEQQVRGLKIDPEVPIVGDVGGQAKVAKLYRREGLPAAGECLRLQASYEIICREIVSAVDALKKVRFGPYRKDHRYRYFTRPEEKIETGLPAIVRQAEKLRGRRRTAWDVARAAYEWVLQRTEYRLIDGLGGAAYCLSRGHGECGDYSALFVALCRAAGVPARPVTGFWADKTDGWHCWAEFMLPSGQWVPVDASLGDQNAPNRHRYFGGLDNRRVALCKTYDVTLVNSGLGHRQLDFLQVGAWWWQGAQQPEEKRTPRAKFSVVGKPLDG